MFTDFRDFLHATLQVNTSHFGKFTCYWHFLPGDVMLTSVESWHSPTKINISLKQKKDLSRFLHHTKD